MRVSKRIDATLLTKELDAALVPNNGVVTWGYPDAPGDTEVVQPDLEGGTMELPPEAVPVVNAHVAPPLVVDYAETRSVNAVARTTDAAAHEVFRFPCDQHRLYQASLTISGVDAGNFVSKIMEGRFTWKRVAAGAVVVGLTVVSDVHDAAAASWAPNFHVEINDVVFTVAGATGRTVDWLLVGPVGVYAPAGLEG